MSFKTVLFGKVDLDTILTALIMGVNPIETAFRALRGSASSAELSDKDTLCIEVGGSGRTSENNFDHHDSKMSPLAACAQALERLARIVRYVDEVDRGERLGNGPEIHSSGFPSLVQLVSGMLLSVKNPEEQMVQGLVILRAVLHSGIDPYGSMEGILDAVPGARGWAQAKREHEALFAEVCAQAQWFITKAGRKLAVVETTWVGAPGALYGEGADLVVALNPQFERAGQTVRKFTVAGKGVAVTEVINRLNTLEDGWGGPAHGTIGGSPQDRSSELSLETVRQAVVELL